MVVLVFVDENPEELVQCCRLAIHCRAQVVIAVDDFPVQFGAQAFLLDVPHADGFEVSTDANTVEVDFEVRAHTDFQPGLVVKAEITHFDGAARVRQQFAGGRVVQQRFLNGQRGAQLLTGDQHFPFRVLAPRIQQFVGEHSARVNRLRRLNQIGLRAGYFERLRFLCFLRDQVRIDNRQLLEQRVTASAGFHLRRQGGVVLFDAGFHRCCRFLLAFFNALELGRQSHVALPCFFQRCTHRHLRRQGGVVLFQQRFDIVGGQQRWQVGVVLIDKRADRCRRGECAFRDYRFNAEFGIQQFRLQGQCMHQVAHVQNRRAFFRDGLLDVARVEVHQGHTGIFHLC